MKDEVMRFADVPEGSRCFWSKPERRSADPFKPGSATGTRLVWVKIAPTLHAGSELAPRSNAVRLPDGALSTVSDDLMVTVRAV